MRIFLCGDVMTGRGIDQVLPHPCDPRLHESHMELATGYVRLAEQANGPIPTPVDFPYIWGAALHELKHTRPDARIINLENAALRAATTMSPKASTKQQATSSRTLAAWPLRGLTAACSATITFLIGGVPESARHPETLERLRIKTAGAGRNAAQASAPAILEVTDAGRVLVFSFASAASGTPRDWAATHDAAGVNLLLAALSEATVAAITDQVTAVRRANDAVVISLHWGPNWSYDFPEKQRWFAHQLIDRADVSIVHGHSSHHAKAIEVYKNWLILYGCGDFLNDYEGIKGYGEFRGDLALMYIADLGPRSLDLVPHELVPLQIRRLQLIRAASEDVNWLHQTLDRESRQFGTRVRIATEGRLALSWPAVRM